MNSLKDIEHDVAMQVPEAIGSALKDWHSGIASPQQQKMTYNFIVYQLCGVYQLAFAIPGEAHLMAWHNGRRFVGLQIERIVKTPMEEQKPQLPPARTMTERARRRGAV